MHPVEREKMIIASLTEGKVTAVEYLSEKLQVSEATIRRDLKILDEQNLIRRIRGGAMPITKKAKELFPPNLEGKSAFSQTKIKNRSAKEAIAKRAVLLCQPFEPLIIDCGSSTFLFAQHLPDEPRQILTTSLLIINTLVEKEHIRVMSTGGEIYRQQNVILNPFEDSILNNFHAKKLIISVQGISEYGLLQTDPLLVQLEKNLIKKAQEVIVLADSSKFTSSAPLAVCGLDDINIVVTDSNISREAREMLNSNNVQLIIAD